MKSLSLLDYALIEAGSHNKYIMILLIINMWYMMREYDYTWCYYIFNKKRISSPNYLFLMLVI